MKRITLILVIASLTVGLVGCQYLKDFLSSGGGKGTNAPVATPKVP